MPLLKLHNPAPGLRHPTSYGRPDRDLKKLPIHPTGQRLYQLGKDPVEQTGPGSPPENFIGVWNSITEWYIYWALIRKTEPGRDPRKPPFAGNAYFIYQKQEDGGRVPGGSVTDFALRTPTGWIGLRVETERFHVFADAYTQMRDEYISNHLKSMEKVIRVFDQDFMGDPTGRLAMAVVADALKGIERPSPIRFGTARRVRQ